MPWRRRRGSWVSSGWWPDRSSAPVTTLTRWCRAMRTEITLPELGLPANRRVTLSVWYAEQGDLVFEGDRLVEVLTDGATFDVPSPATGRLVERRAYLRDVLRPGQVLGLVEAEEEITR